MLFSIAMDIFAFVMWMKYKNKTEESKVRKEEEEVIKFYSDKENKYCLLFFSFLLIDLFMLLVTF